VPSTPTEDWHELATALDGWLDGVLATSQPPAEPAPA